MPHGLSAPPFGAPGLTAKETQATRDFITDNHWVLERGILIDSASVDAGNTPTTKLRPGLALVRAEAGGAIGKYVPFDHTDAPAAAAMKDGVILSYFVNMLDAAGVVEDKLVAGVKAGFVDETKILYAGAIAADKDKLKAILKNVHFEE
ncbi:MAG: hypothetical protein LN413_00035 [Candidatus Thermoplasmatota archaeon]|nr:hypothetical protein [Candidatus Thermoplasmatota archaeon]